LKHRKLVHLRSRNIALRQSEDSSLQPPLKRLPRQPLSPRRSPNLNAHLFSSYMISLHSRDSLLHHRAGLQRQAHSCMPQAGSWPCTSLILRWYLQRGSPQYAREGRSSVSPVTDSSFCASSERRSGPPWGDLEFEERLARHWRLGSPKGAAALETS
jgi:hypothetical protein